jgi:hypothetical protein
LELAADTYSALVSYLQECGSDAEPEEAAAVAIEEWIAHERRRALGSVGARANPDPGRGYQWKDLFLPSGSRLRMSCQSTYYYAEVRGDDIMFEGRSVSPAQMANTVGGNTRNAWRDISILLPGETRWKRASLRRRQAQQLEERLAAGPSAPLPPPLVQPASEPVDATVHLRRLANLIEQALATRNSPQYRRRTDSLGDDVPFD